MINKQKLVMYLIAAKKKKKRCRFGEHKKKKNTHTIPNLKVKKFTKGHGFTLKKLTTKKFNSIHSKFKNQN